jgi:transcriptional regulator with XRE-family HTH domain
LEVFKKRLGKRIKQIRKDRGFSTQADLAEALGTDQVTVGRWEAGIHFPNDEYLEKLLEVLSIGEDELFGSDSAVSPTLKELTNVIQNQESAIRELKSILRRIPPDIIEKLELISAADWDSFRGMKGWPIPAASAKKTSTSS